MSRPGWMERLRQLMSMSLPVLEGSKPSRDEVLRIHIDLGTERLHVGTLSFQDPFWLFRYSPEFIKREDVPAISAFPDKTKTYMSRELWPFFRVRLPPPRDDVQEAMDEYGIRSSDLFGMLGFIGKRTPTSPYEFELDRPSHAPT